MAGTLSVISLRIYYCQATILHVRLTCLIMSVTCQSTSKSSSTLAPNFTGINVKTTLVSQGGVFELGLTSALRPSGTVYTLAIWYVQTPTPKTVVWVADRSMALHSASLSLSAAGDLEVHGTNSGDSSPTVVWTLTPLM